ncbi:MULTISPECIES: ABC transporter permease [Corynebacterium]|uniref:ABC transporter permease n=1 Tax=Corynebacterium TaxID=1716 RepID=UPI000A90EE77|nr:MULTISPECIES: iron ABC transporter permease [Corynebacterium]
MSQRNPTIARTRWTQRLLQPANILAVMMAALFVYIMAIPVIMMIKDAVTVQPADGVKTGQGPGELTSYYLWRTLRSPVSVDLFWRPLGNTLSIALVVIFLTLIFGTFLALLVQKSNVYGRKWFATALIIPYVLPSWTFALAWQTIFTNRTTGGQSGWLENAGLNPPDWLAYGRIPMIIIFTLHYGPLVFLLISNSLSRIDSRNEEAALNAGADRLTVLWKITLPLLRPAILSASTLVLAKSIGEFGAAYVIGLPVNFSVLSTSLYQSINTRQTGVAAVLASALILIGAIGLFADYLFLRNARKYVTITGKGNSSRVNPLGSWRIPATALVGLAFATSVLLPLGTLLLSTIMRYPGNFELSNFTLDYWIGHNLPTQAFRDGLLINSKLWSALWNTVWIAAIAAAAAALMGMLTGYAVTRTTSSPLANLLKQLAFIPYLVPGISFAVAYLSLFAVQRGPIPPLYGTTFILILILAADEVPFASRSGISSMMQLGKESEEASLNAGASWGRTIAKIVLPIQNSALAAAFVLPFISATQALSPVIILATSETNLLTTLSMNLVDYGYTHAANGVTLMICLVALLGMVITRKVLKVDMGKGIS